MTRLVFAAFALSATLVALSADVVDLNGRWELTTFPQPDGGAVRSVPIPDGLGAKTYQATVPGCCELELVKAGELPDPMVGMNNFSFRALEGNQWLYAKKFTAPQVGSGENAVLVFDGIDTLADVFLNGERIGSPENMLIPHEFDVTDRIRRGGENLVQVLIRPVGLAARDVLLGELGYAMAGGADHERIRKAPYMYGWDTAPRLPVSGLWRDVRLEVRPSVRIEHPAWMVRGIDRERRTADVSCRARIRAPFAVYHHAKVVFTLSRNGKVAARAERFFLGPHVRGDFRADDVSFWWPAGAGEPALYDAKIELVADDGKTLAEQVSKIGIRTVALDYDDRKLPERPGRFLFRINGEPIYVRGTDWIPTDVIPARQKDRILPTLKLVREMNCNLVRIWGGGVYESDEFYDWCDANGIMVWQDFMMACTIPPQDDEFCAAMRKEVLSVVLRLRNHASLVLWAGDNENDLAGAWSLGGLRRDPNDNRLTRKVIPDVLFEYDVTRPYLPSSPYVSREAYAGKVEPAEDHLWNGPRAWWKTKYYVDSPCWFCSEGGGFALPCRDSLERMLPAGEADRIWENPDEPDWRKLVWTEAWQHRSTCPNLEPGIAPWNRVGLVTRMSAALWGSVPRHDLDTFIEQSQVAQAEAIKFQVEHFRGQKFVSKGGFVVWNVRDAWPTISDAVTDWYGSRKKAFYAQKAAQADVLMMITESGVLRAVNDTLAPVSGHVRVSDKTTGKTVFDGDYSVAANGMADVATCTWDGQGVFAIDYSAGGRSFHSHYLYGEPPFDWTRMSKLLENEFADALEDAPIRPGDTAKGVRFWNDYATLFHVAPVLSFDAVKGASRYEYAIARGDWSRTVGNGLPEVSLVPLWREMPKGTGWTVACTAFGADGRAIGEAQVRKFTKAAAFEDVKLKPAAQSYRETARKAYMYMTSLPAMRTLVETGEPEQGYQHNAYVSKTHAAHVNAMLLWAEKMPECRDRALRYAKASAEYLLGEVEPADAVLAGWPPTYGRKPLRCDPKKAGEKDREAMVGNEPRAAVKYRKEVMLIYPAEVGLAFLRYHKATGDARFREAAARIAETFVRIRRPDGTWPLKMILATGEPVGQNVLVPSTLIGFFESLADASGDPRWQKLADECYSYLENGPFRTMNWDGQFEDIEPKPPYQNLTKHNALDGMFELLKRHPGDEDALRLARDLLRYSEDQFVFWEAPCGKDEAIPYPGGKARGPSPSMFKPGGYDYPSVFEQFNCYCSIDASVSKLIRAYLAMWRATGCEKDLRKARALGDQMTREQRPDGRIPTFWTNDWVGEVTYDWLNCMESSAAALLKLAEIEN